MSHYFDHVTFYADVRAYADKEGHTPTDLRNFTNVDARVAAQVWKEQEPSIEFMGSIAPIVRLAGYADLNLNKYVREITWEQQKKKQRRTASRLSKGGSVTSITQASSAKDAQAG